MNPNRPIRIHQPPGNAGANDFQLAIEAGSSILREHERSKYLLPAIFVIGRSYYYRSEFFSALEKFQELESLSEGTLRQEALFWKGLTYLEMGNYREGIRQLEFGVESIEGWDEEILSNIRLLFAQKQTALGNYEEAVANLELALPGIRGQNLTGRALFLKGQLYEMLNEDAGARRAFESVTTYRVDFDLEYHARRKTAIVSRRLGEFDHAHTIFRRLERDDKFTAFRAEMRYEIARTYQMSGDVSEAVIRYRELLAERTIVLPPLIIALTNYGLAEIYRDAFEDYTTASDYFNRAASQRIDSQLLPSDFDAESMAESFGAYARLRGEIARRDSLLALSMLSDQELELLILELQQEEQQRLEQEQRTPSQQEFIGSDNEILLTGTDSVVGDFGFLNINNPVLLNEASLQFQAVWGDRPLADNWRRRAVLSGSRFDQLTILTIEGDEIDLTEQGPGALARLDLGDIPFSEEAKGQMNRELQAFYYELGNVFFLTLNMPDSAAVYYERVVEKGHSLSLTEMALYSLVELALLEEREEDAFHYFQRLIEKVPGSGYAGRLASRMDLNLDEYPVMDQMSTAEQFSALEEQQMGKSRSETAAAFLALAERETEPDARVLLLYEAAQNYMRAAREEMPSVEPIRLWISEQEEISRQRRAFEASRDSSRVMMADTTLSEEEIIRLNEQLEREFEPMDLQSEFPFVGAYWDSTRSLLATLETDYPGSPVTPRVRILRSELQLPDTDLDRDRIMELTPEPKLLSEFDEEREEREQARPPVVLPDEDRDLYAVSFSISLYSYVSESRAIRRAEQLAQEGFETFVCPAETDDGSIWRVSTGIYPTSSVAFSASEQLREPYDVQNFVHRMSNNCQRVGAPVVSAYGLTGLFVAEGESSYSIVLNSFSLLEQALEEAGQLTGEGFRTFVSQAMVSDQIVYRVSVGQFGSIRDAESTARLLPEPYSNQNFIERVMHSDVITTD